MSNFNFSFLPSLSGILFIYLLTHLLLSVNMLRRPMIIEILLSWVGTKIQ